MFQAFNGLHSFLSQDDGQSCLTCGAWFSDDNAETHRGSCSGRTDLVHGFDTSSHSLDDCVDFDETGTCEHTDHGCFCDLCAA